MKSKGFDCSPDECEAKKRHKEHPFGYFEFFDYAHKKEKEGVAQSQCRHCGLWIFPEFQGPDWEGSPDRAAKVGGI